MLNTTLVYLEEGTRYLMLHRVKKEHDANRDKWMGVGGKCEDGESPEECAVREVREETGLELTDYRYRGLVTFVSDRWPGEYMHLFTASGWTGEPIPDCPEGDLEWIEKAELRKLPMWEGDKIFLRLLEEGGPFFSLKLRYEGEKLVYAALNGKEMVYMADTEKKVLLFGFDGLRPVLAVKEALEPFGAEPVPVGRTDYGKTLAALAGFEDAPPAVPSLPGTEEAMGRMAVLVGLDEELDGVLAALRNAGAVCLKAVLTEHNRNWSAAKLYQELSAEHRAIQEGRKG